MNSIHRHLPSLDREIVCYLAFWDIARTEDPLWKEYDAWKALVERRRLMRERIAAYTLLEE